ncbi:MAG: Wzz/FepE/Etk N-terminal domain-containing protein [Micrococcales bacterium]|nr:Wzz/FepE/Etk N-terminal domain-containing protein [Micrococcales bacterium]
MTLREFWNLVTFSKWLVIGATVVGLLAGVGYSQVTEPTYSATTVVQYVSPDVLSPVGVTLNTDPNRLLSTETTDKIGDVLSDPESLRKIEAEYGIAENTVKISVYTATRGDALAAVAAAAEEYIAGLQAQFDTRVRTLEQISMSRAEWLDENAEDALLENTVAAVQYASTLNEYHALRAQIAAASVMSEVAGVRTAAVKAQLSSVATPVVLVVAGLLGAFIGVAAAVVRDALDTKVRAAGSLGRIGERELGTLSDVGPAEASAQDGEPLPVAGRTANAFTQSVRELRTALQATMSDTDGSMLMVAAVQPGVPSGFITANLATSFALSGRRVIVVSGDLRQPSLTSLLVPGGRPRPDPLGTVPTRVPNLRVLLPLHTPLDPADFLATAQVRARLDDLRASADLLVMDAPPVLVAADAAILGSYADATLLVAVDGVTRIGAVEEALARLRAANARPLGVVIASDRRSGTYQPEYSFVGDANLTSGPTMRFPAEPPPPAPRSLPPQQI